MNSRVLADDVYRNEIFNFPLLPISGLHTIKNILKELTYSLNYFKSISLAILSTFLMSPAFNILNEMIYSVFENWLVAPSSGQLRK